MSREAIEKLMDRWASDSEFRESIRTDPDGTLAASGLDLDPDELSAIKKVDWSLSDEDLQARVSKDACCGNGNG